MRASMSVTIACSIFVGCASPIERAFQTGDYQTGCVGLISSTSVTAVGLTNIGWCYERGYLTPQSKQTAIKYYTLAAEVGEPTAIKNLINLGEPIPPRRYVSQGAPQTGASPEQLLGIGAALLRRPPPPRQVNCESYVNGRYIQTTCQ